MPYYERGQWDPSRPTYKINWYKAAGLFLLGLSTALMVTLTYRVLM